MNRIHFTNAMSDCNDKLLKMGVVVEETLKTAIRALTDQDEETAERIIRDDTVINGLETELFDTVTTLLATEQPVAGDLRHLIGAVRIITDLERAGDYAVHIAKTTIRLKGEKYLRPLTVLPRMAETAISMLAQSIEAFMHKDVKKARETAEMDEVIDKGLEEMFSTLLPHMKAYPEDVSQAMELLFLARFLERLGDHVVNICEWVVYTNTGEHVEL